MFLSKIFTRSIIRNASFFNSKHENPQILRAMCTHSEIHITENTDTGSGSGSGSGSSMTKKRIGTHDGTFHCDEALACYLLRLTPKFQNALIVRTRDPEVLAGLDALLDVGGVYEPQEDRYDHHQKGFDCDFGHGFKTKLSASGLVYKHYGTSIISKKLGLSIDHADVDRVFLALYKGFMEEIDAVDNGISQYCEQLPSYIENTHLSARISRMNPNWMEDSNIEKENSHFQQAMRVVGTEFEEILNHYASSWLPARLLVINSLCSRFKIDPSGEIILLERYCPWKAHIFELEQQLNVKTLIKYVVYQDRSPSRWKVQAVAIGPYSFDSRKPLPANWRGLEGSQLAQVTGIDDSIFVHGSGFIGCCRTFSSALSMAKLSLAQ